MLTIEPISAFDDNYIWCIYDSNSLEALVVDPGQAAPVEKFIVTQGLTLTTILVTHHHPDHIGGIQELQKKYSLTVFGPQNPNITSIDTRLADGDALTLLGSNFTIMTIPGHTLDHIAFYTEALAGKPRLFCGDTLFAGGCGRVFEGTYPMMLESLNKLAKLPTNTEVYCAHEYTLANLTFAIAVEPDNNNLQRRIEADAQKRQSNIPTVPTTIGLERETNPFLRSHIPEIIRSAKRYNGQACTNDSDVFSAIRQWKDNF